MEGEGRLLKIYTKSKHYTVGHFVPRFQPPRSAVKKKASQGRRHASKVGGGPNRAKPESRAKPEKERGRGLGRALGEPLPRKILKFRTSNSSIWCILETGILHLMDFSNLLYFFPHSNNNMHSTHKR